MPTPDTLTTNDRVAITLAEGFEEVEALAVADTLYRAGVRADLIAVGESLNVTSSHGITVVADYVLSEVTLSEYALLFLPGGMPGTLNLKAQTAIRAEVERRTQHNAPIAAICAAPSILAEAGALEGKNATANPAFMEAIAQGGAHPSQDSVVVDGTITTSRGAGTALELGVELVRQLLGDEAAAAVRAGVVLP